MPTTARQQGAEPRPEQRQRRGLRHGIQYADQPVRLFVGTRGEVEPIRTARAAVVARGQRPEAIDGNRVAVDIEQLADEGVRGEVEDVDAAIAEIADEEIASKVAE